MIESAISQFRLCDLTISMFVASFGANVDLRLLQSVDIIHHAVQERCWRRMSARFSSCLRPNHSHVDMSQ